MSDTPSNDDANAQPLDIEGVTDLRGLRLFLERYEREILRPIELPAVQSAYWFANRGQFRELLELDAALSANDLLLPFARARLSVGREQLRLLRPMYARCNAGIVHRDLKPANIFIMQAIKFFNFYK